MADAATDAVIGEPFPAVLADQGFPSLCATVGYGVSTSAPGIAMVASSAGLDLGLDPHWAGGVASLVRSVQGRG